MAFYAAIGKRPIHVKREVKGHIANRLQAALWREAFHLVDQGVASWPTSTPPSRTGPACAGR